MRIVRRQGFFWWDLLYCKSPIQSVTRPKFTIYLEGLLENAMQAGQMIPPLMTKRSFVDKSDLGGHHGCKQKPLPEFYWRMSRRVPQNFPCFAMTLFDKACRKIATERGKVNFKISLD